MSPSRHARRSRRLSRKSPVEVTDYDWKGTASLQLLHSGSDVEVNPITNLSPPSPSACTTTSSESPPSIVTHLPFTPGSCHSRNRRGDHIPRPPNAFMVFRSWLWNKDNLKSIERDNRNVSRIAGRCWNELSEAERAPFRRLAEEIKERHAEIFPQYRYSPGSQKKTKAPQRRPQRNANLETEKCKKLADRLLGNVTGRDLAKCFVGGVKEDRSEEMAPSVLAAKESSLSAAPPSVLKKSTTPRESRKTKTPPSVPPQHAITLPTVSAVNERPTTLPPSTHAPELAYPRDCVDDFIATDDIPYLSLDNGIDPTPAKLEHDITTLFPSHLKPGTHSILSGSGPSMVKPGATPFFDSYMLAACAAGGALSASSSQFSEFDVEPYPSLVPLGSPVFSNPFEPSTSTAEHSALLGTLDQLFGQPISPLTTGFPNDYE